MVHAWWCSITFSSSSWGIVEGVSVTMDRVRWTNSKACSFSWFKSLRFSSLVTPEAYYLCYRHKRCPGLATTSNRADLRWYIRHQEFSSESGNNSLRCATSCNEAHDGHFEQFLNHQVVVTQKPCLRQPTVMDIFSLYSDVPSVGLVVHFSFLLYIAPLYP
jgi:hypothetical protein